MKTAKISLSSIKASDAWVELVHELKFDQFKKDHPNLDEDDLTDKFYNEVVCKKFLYGEYGNVELIVDENYNIVGGKLF